MYDKKIGWEWIAGFFEGEGHIYWQDGKKGTKQGMAGRLIVGQKIKAPLQAMYDFLLLEGFHKPRFYLRPASKKCEHSTDIWILTVQWREDVIIMLTAMIPYLFQKAPKAKGVLRKLKKLQADRKSILDKAVDMKQAGNTWVEIKNELHVAGQCISNHARAAGITLVDCRRKSPENRL